MKKFAIAGLLALGLLACPQQQADAWIKVQFGVGLNFSFESGNNSWFWGAFNNGQIPGYPTNVPIGHHYGHGYGGYPMDYGYPASSDDGHHTGQDQGADPKQKSNGSQSQTQAYRYPSNYGTYQPVSYQPSYYYPQANYYQPSYYYPSYGYGYGYSSVPSYWYGN